MPVPAVRTRVLIAGGGPVGLGLAIDLGRRGVPCILIERNDGVIRHPRATAQNARTMEFFRRWGVADAVRHAGAPPDFPATVLYVTNLNGFEIARFDRASHGGAAPVPISPERPQRVNQLWLDPILRDAAEKLADVDLQYRTELLGFEERDGGVQARVASPDGEKTIAASYLIDCTGVRATARRQLEIPMEGDAGLDYNLSIFFKMPELWSYHDKGKAALHFFVDPKGITRNVIQLDGRELWRLGVCDRALYENPESADVAALLAEVFGRDVPFELIGVSRWTAHNLVARSYGAGRVLLAGDAAHLNPPDGGFGLNTGMGDAVDLGWKLAAVLEGWAAPELLASYEAERRPVAMRNVGQSTENHLRSANMRIDSTIADDSAAGRAARAELGDYIRTVQKQTFLTDGIALGYVYRESPAICYDGSPPPEETIVEYRPTTYPGARAPHVARADGSSIVDLFGDGFVLLRLGAQSPPGEAFQEAFTHRGVPLRVVSIEDPIVREVYERNLVLVRPDGHVAWRGNALPADPIAVVDVVRGAAMVRA